MELKGRIIQTLPEQSGQSKSGSTWRKQDNILETQAEYPKKVCFSLWGEKIDQFKVVEGEEVTPVLWIYNNGFKCIHPTNPILVFRRKINTSPGKSAWRNCAPPPPSPSYTSRALSINCGS
ncbi:MAG: DUF3127 domain-containing protein, partial [Bacteroidetes bacterium]|nr:DUF3127 domain-containing protein [Bacteroidota bacterium]